MLSLDLRAEPPVPLTPLPDKPAVPTPTPISAASKSSRSGWNQVKRRVRYLYLKFVRLRGHPKELARGAGGGRVCRDVSAVWGADYSGPQKLDRCLSSESL